MNIRKITNLELI